MPEIYYKKFFISIDTFVKENSQYFFFGENGYYIRYAAELILQKLTAYYKEKIYPDDISIDQLQKKLAITPLLFSKNIFIFYNFEKVKKSLLQKIYKMLQTYSGEHYLIILYEDYISYKNRQDELIKFFLENFISVNFVNLTKEEILHNFIPERCKKNITEKTKNLLYEYTNNNLFLLTQEIEKLLVYTKEKDLITEEDVIKCCSVYETGEIYELLDSLQNRNFKRCVTVLNTLFNNGISPIYIFSVLTNYFRKKNNENTFSQEKMYKILSQLQETDFRLKTTSNPEYVLEVAIFNLWNILRS